ncbi:hypothetical protein CLG96_02985 [Sphingomonas oleivorans]|uniref:Uncharacterized protein n=1 Tax=Sphingomonas oleivorans TaxID=1735121 RepID=A0A2T5G1X4_9SPHN|nr:hypothetical protein CLG96_02985 [Sphingomonas oleivorans]
MLTEKRIAKIERAAASGRCPTIIEPECEEEDAICARLEAEFSEMNRRMGGDGQGRRKGAPVRAAAGQGGCLRIRKSASGARRLRHRSVTPMSPSIRTIGPAVPRGRSGAAAVVLRGKEQWSSMRFQKAGAAVPFVAGLALVPAAASAPCARLLLYPHTLEQPPASWVTYAPGGPSVASGGLFDELMTVIKTKRSRHNEIIERA